MQVMLTDINVWPDIAAIRKQYLAGVAPADTIFEVQRFINPEWLVEIEADAIVSDGSIDDRGDSGRRRFDGSQ